MSRVYPDLYPYLPLSSSVSHCLARVCVNLVCLDAPSATTSGLSRSGQTSRKLHGTAAGLKARPPLATQIGLNQASPGSCQIGRKPQGPMGEGGHGGLGNGGIGLPERGVGQPRLGPLAAGIRPAGLPLGLAPLRSGDDGLPAGRRIGQPPSPRLSAAWSAGQRGWAGDAGTGVDIGMSLALAGR